MASEQQRQTNAMLSQGGEAYGRGMATSMQMDYEAGDPTAQMLGAAAQAGSMYASQGMAKQSQQAAMTLQHERNKELMGMQLESDVGFSSFSPQGQLGSASLRPVGHYTGPFQ